MKKLWSEELRHQAIGEEQGRQRGRWMAALEAGLLAQEDHLEDQHRKLESVRLAAVKNEADLEIQDPGAPPPAVLQTYTVPLQRVRQELAAWVPPMTDEYQSLIEGTKALSPTTMEELEKDPLFVGCWFQPSRLPMGRNEPASSYAATGSRLWMAAARPSRARRSHKTCTLVVQTEPLSDVFFEKPRQ